MDSLAEIIHMDLDGPGKDPRTADLEASIGRELIKFYPHQDWIVEAQPGVVNIRCPKLHARGNVDFGFTLHISKLPRHLDVRRAALMAGGELLERANVSRGSGIRYSEGVDRG